jgi:hypothetical protein
MRLQRVGTGILLLAGSLAVVPAVSADPAVAVDWAKKAMAALEKGTFKEIAGLGDVRAHSVQVHELAKDPDTALAFARVVHDEAPRLARESAPTASVYVTLCRQAAGAMDHAKPDDFRTQRALAYGRIAQGRLLVVQGSPVVPSEWLGAADLAAKSYATPDGMKDGGAFAVGALAWMRAVTGFPGADAAEITKRVEALLAILAKLPDGVFPAVGRAQAKLMAIDALQGQPRPPLPAALQAPFDEVVAILSPHAKPGGEAAALSLWQECVTIARGRKLATKIDYLWGPPAAQLNVTWQLPLGNQWKEAGMSGKDPAYVANLEQRLPDGRVLHRIEVRMYRWDKPYEIGTSPQFKGDSPKQLILAAQAEYKKAFSKVDSFKDVAKGALSEGMPGAQTFSLEGTSATTGEPLSVKSYVVRGKDTKATFLIDAMTFGKPPPEDPEMDAVLKTFREVKAGK